MAIVVEKQGLEELESQLLAGYAMKSATTKGRRFSEPPPRFRTDFQRDRDRIIHSTAFRRLEYKTQVFVNHEGDHYRTRLTHTIEVAQIGKSIARALRLNEDLTEAVILAHDLGHTPFGHAGERAMNDLMASHGGFEHNLQSLRVVDALEARYPKFVGLNLCYEVREGIAKHSTPYDNSSPLDEFDPSISPPLEVQIADVADEIAYNNHDVDDGLASGLLDWQSLCNVGLFRQACEAVATDLARPAIIDDKHVVISAMISLLVDDLLSETARRLESESIQTIDDVRSCKKRLIAFSDDMFAKKNELKDYLMQHMYLHWRVIRMEEKAKRILSDLFNAYMSRGEQLPKDFVSKFDPNTQLANIVCDYLAGMTDRFALDEHKKFFDPHEKV